MAAHTIGLDQSQNFNLLLLVFCAHAPGGNRLCAALVLCQQYEMVADRRVRYIGSGAAVGWQLLEVSAPLFWHSVRVVQVELVELFHICSVTT